MKELDPVKTSLEELKSRSRPERPILKVYRWILACQYVIIAFIIILMIFSGQFSSLRKLYSDPKVNKLKSVTHPLSKLETVKGFSSLPKRTNTKPLEKHEVSSILETIKSNPFRLSTHDMMQQMRSAKIPSLKNRVKRFACWHSCFGQFRRKAFRALYPKPVTPPTPILPSPEPPANATTEDPENTEKKESTENPEKKESTENTEKKETTENSVNKETTENTEKKEGPENAEKKQDKREILNYSQSSKSAPENNELEELEPRAGSNGSNSKPNTTDFFKLKTKEKEIIKLNDSPSPNDIDANHSKENFEATETSNDKKLASNDESELSSRKVSVKSQEVSGSEEGDYEESESGDQSENESEISVSEEAIEDKGDGIDKKDMEVEKNQ